MLNLLCVYKKGVKWRESASSAAVRSLTEDTQVWNVYWKLLALAERLFWHRLCHAPTDSPELIYFAALLLDIVLFVFLSFPSFQYQNNDHRYF